MVAKVVEPRMMLTKPDMRLRSSARHDVAVGSGGAQLNVDGLVPFRPVLWGRAG